MHDAQCDQLTQLDIGNAAWLFCRLLYYAMLRNCRLQLLFIDGCKLGTL